jgi:hypothetical protein
MFHLLAKYEDSEKLNRLLSTFYSRVSNEVTVKHFFMALSLEKMLTDFDRFNQFILDRPQKTYTDSPTQTADPASQVGSSSFKEICHYLVEVLREENIEEDDIPRLVTDIMEIIEESRAEAFDRISTVYEVKNIDYDHLINIFSHANIKAEVDDKSILNIRVRGSPTPIYLKLNTNDQEILFFGKTRCETNDLNALNEIVKIANEQYQHFPVRKLDEDGDLYLYAEHKFSIENGVPSRLLNRIAKQFVVFFECALQCDQHRILKL